VHPALHVQAVEVVLPSGVLELGRQASHTAGPEPALYVPAAHCKQGPPSDPEKPGSHRQSVIASLLSIAVDPGGHAWHVTSSAAPTRCENFPASHSIQSNSAVLAGNGRYLPATQSTQVVCDVAPGLLEYLPLTQLEHVASELAPTAEECLPATQLAHILDAGMAEYLPLSHC